MEQVGRIRVAAYRAGGHMSEDSEYAPHLAALGADGRADVLVAISEHDGDDDGDDDGALAGSILGTVTLQSWPHTGPFVTGPGEAEIRALAVVPGAQGRGVGRALLQAVIERAAARDVTSLVLLTQPDMLVARRLYERAGFQRLPGRDTSPLPGLLLIAYELPGGPAARLI